MCEVHLPKSKCNSFKLMSFDLGKKIDCSPNAVYMKGSVCYCLSSVREAQPEC